MKKIRASIFLSTILLFFVVGCATTQELVVHGSEKETVANAEELTVEFNEELFLIEEVSTESLNGAEMIIDTNGIVVYPDISVIDTSVSGTYPLAFVVKSQNDETISRTIMKTLTVDVDPVSPDDVEEEAMSEEELSETVVDVEVQVPVKGGKLHKPVIHGVSRTVELTVGSDFDPLDGVYAQNYLSDDIGVQMYGYIDTSVEGVYTIKYKAQDSAYNTTVFVSKIHVIARRSEVSKPEGESSKPNASSNDDTLNDLINQKNDLIAQKQWIAQNVRGQEKGLQMKEINLKISEVSRKIGQLKSGHGN